MSLNLKTISLSTFIACLTLEDPPGPSVLVTHTIDPIIENLDHWEFSEIETKVRSLFLTIQKA